MKNKSLRELAEEFIVYKQSIGYIYETPQFYLMKYVSFVENNFEDIQISDKNTVTKFLDTIADKSGSLYSTACVLREFARFLNVRGYDNVYLIPAKRILHTVTRLPYFFTKDEITSFFEKCDSVSYRKENKGREIVIPALFRLLYCCGLRCKEVRTLLCEDVHLHKGYVDVIESKGPNSRRVYISVELIAYLKDYNESILLLFPKRLYFFPHTILTYYKGGFVSQNFKRLWKCAFPNFKSSSFPIAYDFRHHFAYANLNRWAKEGIDVNVMLPYLMRYMGHKHISSTLYYFHFVPEFFPTFSEFSKSTESIIPEVPYEE